ncbi:sirohydrochlorin chelatase [Streptomyces sp. 4N509B]|uniref:sirohydrochlorin chelatase n=1 Tax=Streptomyces sp. 4N509B TaxID=3457413 RepID=UPI003FD4A128
MSSPTPPASGLPVRMPRPRKPGRHRRPEPVTAPQGAPALVLAVPGQPSRESRDLADEVVSIARAELPGLDARVGFVEPAPEGEEAEFATLGDVLAQAVADRPGDTEGPLAVVIPLLAGPEPGHLAAIEQTAAASGAQVLVAGALGPHPLLAEAVHVRLSEAGLARADRARLFTVATAADGIVLAAVGGAEAVRAAGITGMLLSARLAVPVLAAALDEEGSVEETARKLLSSGSQQLALAPYLIGPEAPEGMLATATKEAGCPAAEPLGAYPAVGKLVLSVYMSELGLTPETSPAR